MAQSGRPGRAITAAALVALAAGGYIGTIRAVGQQSITGALKRREEERGD
jgi:hypothetical protein